MRRYRLFLIVAALAAVTIYCLSVRESGDVVEYETAQYGTPYRDSIQPVKEDKPVEVDEPLIVISSTTPRSRPASEPSTIVSSLVIDITTSRARPESTRSSERSSTHTTSSDLAEPTEPLEDLLVVQTEYAADLSNEDSGRLNIDWRPQDGTQPRWQKPQIHFPLDPQKVMNLPNSEPVKLPKIQAKFSTESSAEKRDRISKLNTVKTSFLHAWKGYKKHGLPHDEVKPISKTFADPFMGWGATLVDSLDTLWIMGLEDEFRNATSLIAKIDFQTSLRKDIPLFETVIRYLGGLLGAYDVSDYKYPVLLTKAEELAEILMGAFDTPNRMPITFYNWAPSYTSQSHRAGSHAVMAELGSLSVEMTRLAQLTGNRKYYDAIARVTNEFEKWQPETLIPGLWPLKVDASGCKKVDHRGTTVNGDMSLPVLMDSEADAEADAAVIHKVEEDPAYLPVPATKGKVESQNLERRAPPVTDPRRKHQTPPRPMQYVEQELLAVECTPQGLAPAPNKAEIYGIGGQADSTYEYLPKMHALLRGRTGQYERMYKSSAKAIRETLLFRPMIKDSTRKILFAAKHELDPKANDAKKEVISYEITHLSCFVGGMFALGARLFGIKEDLELAKQLTDGCVWAYSSMPAGIMAETATIVPCPDLKVCKWDQKKWHDALDPDIKERITAVDQWNEKQKEIYESSKSLAIKEAAVADEGIAAERTPAAKAESSQDRVERSLSDEVPSATTSFLDYEQRDEDGAEFATGPIEFVPKTAFSHDRYVQARIQEERLPPSYTKITARHYGLRPEAIESVFYMYRITGDNIWRQKGWEMFGAIQSATQTEVANAGVKDVTSGLGDLDDTMESFWLAETLKYFYLLFDEPERWSLDHWVLNTEAHFLRIPE